MLLTEVFLFLELVLLRVVRGSVLFAIVINTPLEEVQWVY